MKSSNTTAILASLLEPVNRCLNEEAARKLCDLKADAKTAKRIEHLARACNEGALTSEERLEYERYVAVGDVIAIMQAKARLLLLNAR